MSRFSESPSPRDNYEAPLPRGRRHAEPSDGKDGRWIGRSQSGPRGNIRGRGSAYLPSRSRSRSFDGQRDAPPREPERQGRPRHRRADPQDIPPEQAPDDEFDGAPAPRQRGERRREERPRPSRRQGEGDGPLGDEVPQERDRGRDPRQRPGRDKDRDYSRKMMEAQQAQMRSMMGMMNPAAMQMAMMQQQMQMGMVHPAYMQAMQQQQQMMMNAKRGGAKQAGGSSSDSGDDSSSSSSGDGPGVPNQAAAMAAMAAMYGHGHPAAGSGGPPPQVGDFKPPPGMPPLPPPPPPPPGSRPPSFHAGGGHDENSEAKTGPPVDPKEPMRGPGARGSAKKEIEKMIDEYRLSVGCAWTMRALPPDKQKLAARIDPSGQEDPSGYVAEQLKNIV